jgi:hypothetical protein
MQDRGRTSFYPQIPQIPQITQIFNLKGDTTPLRGTSK